MTAPIGELGVLMTRFHASSDRVSRALGESDLDGLAAVIEERERLIRSMEPLLRQVHDAGSGRRGLEDYAPVAELLQAELRANDQLLMELSAARDDIRTEIAQIQEVSTRSARYRPDVDAVGTIDLTR